MVTRTELWLYIGIGILLSIVATFPLFQHSTYISNHGDINRGLIYSGVARQSILAGHMPLWNPYLCGGSPLLADVESWFLQPFFFLTLPFNELMAMKISFALTLCTAFIGFAVLGRKILGFGNMGALTFGLIMAFSGYISQHLAEGYYVWISSAWIPWFLLTGILSLKYTRYIPIAGLMLAFMFGGGSMHMVVYSLVFLGLLFLFQKSSVTISKRILILLGIILSFIVFASVKLLPTLSVLATNESRLGFTPSITLLPNMLLSRGVLPAISYNGDMYRWGEFGNYIGYISVVLVCIALLYKRKGIWNRYRGFFLASIIMFALAFSTFPLTHGIVSKVGDLFRMPSRLMIFPLIGVAIFAARGMDSIRSQQQRLSLAIAIVVVLAADLLSNDYKLFTRTFSIPLPEIHRETTFMRVKHSYTTPDGVYYRAAYIDYLENRGVNDLCRFYQHIPATSTINGSDKKKPYRGEVYLADSAAGSVQLLERSLNKLSIQASIQTATNILVNMNYYQGWKTKEGFVVQDKDGLIAVQVAPGDHTFTLYYAPTIIYWSVLISFSGLLLGLLWFFIV